MAYWIFKTTDQTLYPDMPGKKYVYDNTHSIRVVKGDTFIYLDKREKYSFTATGTVHKLKNRPPTAKEASRTANVRKVFEAHLMDVLTFDEPLSISPVTRQGKKNRAKLGIVDVNLLGWSQSMPSLTESMYRAILDLAEIEKIIPSTSGKAGSFEVHDKWSPTKTRGALKHFTVPVMTRSDSSCIICGTSVLGTLDAAHLSPYATDKKNRGNPANGICLCKYCHKLFDLRLIAIESSGKLMVNPTLTDPVAKHHLSQIKTPQRKKWLKGVDPNFLKLTIKWHKENLPK